MVKILIVLLEGETCFNVLQALSSKTILVQFRKLACTSSAKPHDLFRFSNAQCNHMGCLNGQIYLLKRTSCIQSDTFETTFLRLTV